MSSRLRFDSTGWVAGARIVASPNRDARSGAGVDLLVVHSITLPPGQFGGDAILRLFTNSLDPSLHPSFEEIQHLRVSAHFLIRRDGELIQFVDCDHRAWHAGKSSFEGRDACNDFSIGIELEGTDMVAFDERQYLCLANLVPVLMQRYPLFAIAAHSDIAPGRKTDPGPRFDWQRVSLDIPDLRRMKDPPSA